MYKHLLAALWLWTGAVVTSASASEQPADAVEAPGGGEIGSPAARAERLRPALRPKQIRAGRITSLTSWGLLAVGGITAGTGGLLTIYDYDGPWQDKWRYDEAYLAREPAGRALLTAGWVTAVSSTPLLVAGTLAEGVGLSKVTRLTLVPGWVGLGLYVTGASLTPLAFATFSPGFLVATLGTTGAGWILSIAQFGLNVRASRRLPAVDRAYYYRRVKPVVSAAPTFLEKGGGASVVVIW